MIDIEYIALGFAIFIAGIMDGAMGGGGVITVPAIQWLYPQLSWMQVFAVSKSTTTWGIGIACWQYLKHIPSLEIRKKLAWTIPLAFASGLAGAYLIETIDKSFMRWIVIGLLTMATLYVIFKPNLAHHKADESQIKHTRSWKWGALTLPIGAYDGFFGPGAGSFYLLGSVTVLKLSLLQAQAVSKAWNCTSILGGLTYFVINGHATWHFLPLGIVNMLGGWIGSKIVLKQNNHFIRYLFIATTTLLISRLIYQALKS